jgi:hypothetical protein
MQTKADYMNMKQCSQMPQQRICERPCVTNYILSSPLEKLSTHPRSDIIFVHVMSLELQIDSLYLAKLRNKLVKTNTCFTN